MPRRRFLAAATLPLAAPFMPLAALAQPAAPPLIDKPPFPADGRIGFRITRNGTAIGSHELFLTRVEGGFDIRIAVEMVVKFGPIALFRYKLDGLEQWRGGQVVRASADTNDDGKPNRMRAERDASGLQVEGSKGPRYLAPRDALVATHWNAAELRGPWINPQNGELLRPMVTDRGTEPVTVAGRSVMARQYELTGDAKMKLWYDTDQQWSALLFVADDGSTVRYDRS